MCLSIEIEFEWLPTYCLTLFLCPTFVQDFTLHSTLREYTCSEKCPYGQNGVIHPISARGYGTKFNAAAIPVPLAEEVADHVFSTFYQRRIRFTKEVELTDEEIAEFDAAMSG